MADLFRSAKLKFQRADQHFLDLRLKVDQFAATHPHRLSVTPDPATGNDVLSIAPGEPFPDEYLLILGDILHNLGSALDHAWYASVERTNDQSKFPLHASEKRVVEKVNGLKDNASEALKKFIVDIVQPWETGRGRHLWGVHQLDNVDKHRLLIAHRQFSFIPGMKAVDTDTGEAFDIPSWLIVPPYTASREMPGHPHFRLAGEIRAESRAIFGEGCFQGKFVMPTLVEFREAVSGTVDIMEMLKTNAS
jgi:hypothetical protein